MGKKQGGKAFGMPAGIGIGILIAIIVTLLGAVAVTGLIAGEKLSLDAVGYGVMVMEFLAGLVGALVAMQAVKHKKMQVCLMTGAGYFLVLLAMNAMFFGGQYEGVWVSALLIFASAGITAVVGSREKKGGRSRRRRPVYR